jgi:AcrR family transcriptional regulator
MKLRAREAAASAILEAAEEVAATRGLEATSTSAIAERAGVSVGTLYNYFPDRDALLAALFKYRREQMLPRVVAAAEAARHLPFEERLRTYLGAIARAFDEFRPFCRVAMSAEAARVKRQTVVLTAITDALIEILAPAVGADHAADYSHMMFGALKSMMHERLERDESFEPAARMIADTFLPGIVQR